MRRASGPKSSLSTDEDSAVLVGRVIRPHGLRGGVVVEPITDRPVERFSPGSVVLDPDGYPLTVRRFEATERAPVITFEEIGDRDQAERLRGLYLYVNEYQRRDLEDEEYWPEDLVGADVFGPDGRRIGSVTDVEIGVGQDRLLIATPAGPVTVPFVSEIVTDVDLDGRRIVVDPPDGLID